MEQEKTDVETDSVFMVGKAYFSSHDDILDFMIFCHTLIKTRCMMFVGFRSELRHLSLHTINVIFKLESNKIRHTITQ